MIHRDNYAHFTVLIILLFIVSFSAFASYDPVIPSNRNFWLTHSIGLDNRFSYFYTGTDAQHVGTITSYEFPEAGVYRFARFCIKYNQDISFTSIVLAFTPLVHNEDNQEFYDYTVRILEPHTNTVFADVEPQIGGNYKYTSELVSTEMTFEKTTAGDWQEAEIADLEITLDDSNSIAGQYSGSITCSITAKDTI